MKLSSTGHLDNIYKSGTQSCGNKNNVDFTGTAEMLDGMVKFWQFIDNGGRAYQFTCEDVFGTNIPRSYKGLMAGKKYTGKYNWVAFMQEAIREFLTGPIMTFAPMGFLAVSIAKFGPSVGIKNENVCNLSHLMNKIEKGQYEPTTLKKEFFTTVSNDMLDCVLGDEIDKDSFKKASESLTKALGDYANEFEKNPKLKICLFGKKKEKELLKEKAENLNETFTNIVKKYKKDFSDTNFQTVKYSLKDNKEQIGSINFKSYSESAAAYISDFIKANKTDKNTVNVTESAIKNFKNNTTGKRILTIFNMIVLTGILMRQIPKIYTSISGKTNPNASSIYIEAQKRQENSKETSN